MRKEVQYVSESLSEGAEPMGLHLWSNRHLIRSVYHVFTEETGYIRCL